uniref:HAT C-terminal dimerisation domain-containing protein n=1 Tax=Solanum lycopersicum TaxID=4081 RepID=A0A3Q7I4E4_SOLLC
MARDILIIPITTVSSESTFSIGGGIIGKFQSSILPSNAEAKLCAKDCFVDKKIVMDQTPMRMKLQWNFNRILLNLARIDRGVR